MKEIITKRVVETTTYLSFDGNEYNSEEECLFYDWRCTALKVYVVTVEGPYAIGIEAYSTRELAEQAIKTFDKDKCTITELYIDEKDYFRNN